MPFPTWCMPAQSWLAKILCGFTMLLFVGCYSPSHGPFGNQGYPYRGGPPPGNYPSGGYPQPGGGTSLGTPTPIDGGNYGSGSKNNPHPDDGGFNGGSSRKGGSYNSGFGQRETSRDEGLHQNGRVPNYPDVNDIRKPSRDDDHLESHFDEANQKSKFDTTPKKHEGDHFDEFNGDDAKSFKSNKEEMHDDSPFENGAQFQVPSSLPLITASSSRELEKKEDVVVKEEVAAIDRFIKESAQPSPYAYDKQQHKWLRGVVDYDQQSGSWSIIYDDQPDKEDVYGGSMTLVESPKLAKLHDHDIVLVEGEVDQTVDADRLGKPLFRVQHLFGPLVPKKAGSKIAAPVAN
ncbi:hypothetical protein MNBD_PLANCTO02-2120 [hydrothermal vent metagenome]|uniref:Uncharacterized protein n=1 Tax=hydrothermal vent metagenome TaxID=652676 RepID=A0A3B1DNF1_9ZZZZ